MSEQTVTVPIHHVTEQNTRRIVVGVDGSPSSIAALRWAGRTALLLGARIEAIAVPERASSWYGYSTESQIVSPHDDAIRGLAETVATAYGAGRPEVSEIVRPGHTPAEVLCTAAEGAELLVVGAHGRGRGGVPGFLLGSVSTACAERATCPVVIVPPEAGAART